MAKARITDKMSAEESAFLMAMRMLGIQFPSETAKIAFRLAAVIKEKGRSISMEEIALIGKDVWDGK